MLSSKSQYILSKIGIPLFEPFDAEPSTSNTPIFYYQKDCILTLHANSADNYSEKELQLLNAIIAPIKGEASIILTGALSSSEMTLSALQESIGSNEAPKLILAFLNLESSEQGLNWIQAPSLSSLVDSPALKKDLWSQLKPFQSV